MSHEEHAERVINEAFKVIYGHRFDPAVDGVTPAGVIAERLQQAGLIGGEVKIPSRQEVAAAIREAIDNPRTASWDMDLDAADAVLELFTEPEESQVTWQRNAEPDPDEFPIIVSISCPKCGQTTVSKRVRRLGESIPVEGSLRCLCKRGQEVAEETEPEEGEEEESFLLNSPVSIVNQVGRVIWETDQRERGSLSVVGAHILASVLYERGLLLEPFRTVPTVEELTIVLEKWNLSAGGPWVIANPSGPGPWLEANIHREIARKVVETISAAPTVSAAQATALEWFAGRFRRDDPEGLIGKAGGDLEEQVRGMEVVLQSMEEAAEKLRRGEKI